MYEMDLVCGCGFRIVNPQDSDYRMEDGERYFPKCPHCGEFMKNDGGRGIPSGDPQVFFAQELGALGKTQVDYKRRHPDAEFSKTGALKIKGPSHLKSVLKEKGMVNLCEDRSYRETRIHN